MVLAARLRRHGQVPVCESASEPEPDGDGVVVEMLVAALNPVDLRVVGGQVATDAPLPRVVGLEGVGRLDGETVLVSGSGVGLTSDGTLAERVAVPRSAVRPVPPGADLGQASCCGVVGATAVRVAELAHLSEADRILVLGGGGAVGQALCQLVGDEVEDIFAQVRSEDGAAAVRRAGAEPLRASEPDELEAAIRRLAPTVVLDGIGGDWTSAALDALPERARVVLYGASGDEPQLRFDGLGFYRRSLSIRGYSGMSEDPKLLSKAIDQALEAVGDGCLDLPVAARLPLERVDEAYGLLADPSVRGKILVDLTPADR